jgi:hypothetical protein
MISEYNFDERNPFIEEILLSSFEAVLDNIFSLKSLRHVDIPKVTEDTALDLFVTPILLCALRISDNCFSLLSSKWLKSNEAARLTRCAILYIVQSLLSTYDTVIDEFKNDVKINLIVDNLLTVILKNKELSTIDINELLITSKSVDWILAPIADHPSLSVYKSDHYNFVFHTDAFSEDELYYSFVKLLRKIVGVFNGRKILRDETFYFHLF